jgi:ParB family chromosome partitioning protein
VEAVGGHAGLAVVAHLGDQGALDSRVQVGVGEDDERRVAAELHRHPQQVLGALLHQRLAHLGRPGEGHLAQPRIRHQGTDRLAGAGAGDDVEHAVGQAGLGQELRQPHRRQRRQLGRLEHHRAARRDRGPDLAGPHRQREVPRRDEQAGAHRLLHGEQPLGRGRRPRVAALDPHRLLAEPAEELGAVGDLGLGLGEALAHLHRHQQRQLARLLGHGLERAPQDLAAFPRRRRGPAGLRGGSGVEGGARLVGACVGDVGEPLPRRRVLDREGLAAGRLAPLAADEQPARQRVEDRSLPRVGRRRGAVRAGGATCPVLLRLRHLVDLPGSPVRRSAGKVLL